MRVIKTRKIKGQSDPDGLDGFRVGNDLLQLKEDDNGYFIISQNVLKSPVWPESIKEKLRALPLIKHSRKVEDEDIDEELEKLKGKGLGYIKNRFNKSDTEKNGFSIKQLARRLGIEFNDRTEDEITRDIVAALELRNKNKEKNNKK